MKDRKKKLERYINQLNAGRRPDLHSKQPKSNELKDLTAVIREVKSLKDPQMPDDNYEKRLLAALKNSNYNQDQGEYEFMDKNKIRNNNSTTHHKMTWKTGKRILIGVTAATAAAVLIFTASNVLMPDANMSIAYAMEQAMQELKAYHGIIEVLTTNQAGDQMLQSRREVWADQEGNYYLKELSGYSEGVITVNNSQREWQIRPKEKLVYLSPAFPDPYRFTFDLGDEINHVSRALKIKEVGEESVSGREAIILEVTPDGGETYRLWVDKATDLPLKKQSAMQNAFQVTITYTEIEFLETIPQELLTYEPISGYNEVESNPEQTVTSVEEAENIVGFAPVLPTTVADDYSLKGISVLTDTSTVQLHYGSVDSRLKVMLLQSKAVVELEPASNAILGSVKGNTAEILERYQGVDQMTSIRWQEEGVEYRVFGNLAWEELTGFVKSISNGEVTLPPASVGQPQIQVPVDLVVEENDQKSVDAGHSPWKLDPVFVAHVFANLLISPEGITGDYPIPYEAVELVENNGLQAKLRINDDKSIAEYVYLERLIRQDNTGIWTVIGYDTRK